MGKYYFMGLKSGKTKANKVWNRVTIFDYDHQVTTQIFVNDDIIKELELDDMTPYTCIDENISFTPVSINNNVYYTIVLKN